MRLPLRGFSIYDKIKMMKKFFILFYSFTLLLCAPAARADDWLPNFEDIPKMDLTYVVEDDGFVYSQPDGKIAQTTVASDAVTRRQFQRFYRDALDELGWKKIKDDSDRQIFRRGNEELKIEIVKTDPLTAKFTVAPK